MPFGQSASHGVRHLDAAPWAVGVFAYCLDSYFLPFLICALLALFAALLLERLHSPCRALVLHLAAVHPPARNLHHYPALHFTAAADFFPYARADPFGLLDEHMWLL